MALKYSLFPEIMNDVIRATVKEHNKQPGRMEWRVLVVDDQSMRMVSACTKMHELSAEGITSNVIFLNNFFPSNCNGLLSKNIKTRRFDRKTHEKIVSSSMGRQVDNEF